MERQQCLHSIIDTSIPGVSIMAPEWHPEGHPQHPTTPLGRYGSGGSLNVAQLQQQAASSRAPYVPVGLGSTQSGLWCGVQPPQALGLSPSRTGGHPGHRRANSCGGSVSGHPGGNGRFQIPPYGNTYSQAQQHFGSNVQFPHPSSPRGGPPFGSSVNAPVALHPAQLRIAMKQGVGGVMQHPQAGLRQHGPVHGQGIPKAHTPPPNMHHHHHHHNLSMGDEHLLGLCMMDQPGMGLPHGSSHLGQEHAGLGLYNPPPRKKRGGVGAQTRRAQRREHLHIQHFEKQLLAMVDHDEGTEEGSEDGSCSGSALDGGEDRRDLSPWSFSTHTMSPLAGADLLCERETLVRASSAPSVQRMEELVADISVLSLRPPAINTHIPSTFEKRHHALPSSTTSATARLGRSASGSGLSTTPNGLGQATPAWGPLQTHLLKEREREAQLRRANSCSGPISTSVPPKSGGSKPRGGLSLLATEFSVSAVSSPSLPASPAGSWSLFCSGFDSVLELPGSPTAGLRMEVPGGLSAPVVEPCEIECSLSPTDVVVEAINILIDEAVEPDIIDTHTKEEEPPEPIVIVSPTPPPASRMMIDSLKVDVCGDDRDSRDDSGTSFDSVPDVSSVPPQETRATRHSSSAVGSISDQSLSLSPTTTRADSNSAGPRIFSLFSGATEGWASPSLKPTQAEILTYGLSEVAADSKGIREEESGNMGKIAI